MGSWTLSYDNVGTQGPPYRLLGNTILHDLWLLPQPNVKGISDNDTFETYVSFAEQKNNGQGLWKYIRYKWDQWIHQQ